jgi:hypothetical protein
MPKINLGKGKPICGKPVFFKQPSSRAQIQKEVIPDLKRENQFLSKRGIPVSKLYFSAHSIMVSLLKFGLRTTPPPPHTLSHFIWYHESHYYIGKTVSIYE